MSQPIEEDYVSFETAVLLKSKGFHEEVTDWYYQGRNKPTHREEKEDYNANREGWAIIYSCPSLYIVLKWLRIKYNIDVCIMLNMASNYTAHIFHNKESINKGIDDVRNFIVHTGTPEEATEQAIIYSLKNLVK